MSIIERALGKMQEAGKRVPVYEKMSTPPPAQRAAAAVALAEVREPIKQPEPELPPPPAVEYARTTLDLQALRTAGMLPQQQSELALRNQFRRLKWPLRDSIRQRADRQDWNANLIMVASAAAGEGKTFTSLNLAMSLAREQDCRVVLVDADFAKGHLTTLLGLRDRPGMLDLLADSKLTLDDVLVATDMDRSMFLPAGKYVANAPELLASRRMGQVMLELAQLSPEQVVLFDSSPVLSTNEAQVLGRLMSQILMVVRADHTDRNAVLDAIELLERPKVSFILNQCQVVMGDDYYNSSYGYPADEQKAQ